MRRKILMLSAAVSLTALSWMSPAPASAAVQCDCNYCRIQPSAFCDIRSFHTSCANYYPNFCE